MTYSYMRVSVHVGTAISSGLVALGQINKIEFN